MINEPYFGKYQRKPRGRNAEREVNEKINHQALREAEARSVNRPQESHRRKLCLSQTDTETHLRSEDSQQEKWRRVHWQKNKRMSSLKALLLLSLLIVRCGGCDFDQKGVENIKETIDSNPTGFRTVFPKDYYVVHHYTKSMLCQTDPCCVFSSAVVLLDSWNVLLTNLWDEHINHSLIQELTHTLDKIIKKNKNIEEFQEQTDLTQFPTLSSSPEELLKLTSELFEQWLQVGCSPLAETCQPPTLPPPVVKKDYKPIQARLLTTRALYRGEERQPDKRIDISPPSSNGRSPTVSHPAFVWTLLLFGLYW